jgi:hypothetical protein
MKKIVTVVAILSLIGFASYKAASAHSGRYFGGNNYGPGYCGTYKLVAILKKIRPLSRNSGMILRQSVKRL